MGRRATGGLPQFGPGRSSSVKPSWTPQAGIRPAPLRPSAPASPLPCAPHPHPRLGVPGAKVQVSSEGRQSPGGPLRPGHPLPPEWRAKRGANCWPGKSLARSTMSAEVGRHSGEGRGFVPTEALSAQRLLGEEGKRGRRRGRRREGGLLFQSRHPLRVKNQV